MSADLARHCLRCLLMLLCLAATRATGAAALEPSPELKASRAKMEAFWREEDFDRALEAADKVLALTAAEFGRDAEQVAIQAQSNGLIAEAKGDFAKAERYLRRALAIGEKVYGTDSAINMAILDRVARVVLAAGRTAEARALYQRELKIGQDTLGDHAFTASAHSGLGDVARAEGDFAGALPHYRKAIKLLVSQKAEEAVVKNLFENEIKRNREIFIGLSRAAFALHGQPGANPAALIEESFAAGQSAWSTAAAAALAKMTARLKANDTEMGRAIRQMQALSDRALALSEEDQKGLAAWSDVQRADRTYSELLEQFRAMSIEQGRINAPFAKRQRELVARMQEGLERCPPGEKKPGCEGSDKEREAIGKELSALSAETSKGTGDMMKLYQRMNAAEQALPGYAEHTARRKALLDEAQALNAEVSKQRAAVVAAFPQFLSLSEPAPLTIAETQGLLRDDEALVSILVGAGKTFVWAVSKERAEWAEVSVGEKVLAEHVAALRLGLDPLAPGVSDSVATTAEGSFDMLRAYVVYKLLLDPFKALLAGKQHLLLVPTGALTSLPFQVLLTDPPRSGARPGEAFAEANWLIRRHALSVLPTVESLRSLRQFAAEGTAVKPFFGLGDPVLLGPSGGQRQRAAVQPDQFYRNGVADLRALSQLMPLPDTAKELEAIAKILGAPRDAVALREAATETRLKSMRLKDYRILQFATHGLVAGDLSGLAEPALVLTPPANPTPEDDGLLTASEIVGLDLDADWVVLSACNTASGETVGAEALSGLARAFFFAGARAILVSHWSVYSDAAVQLTTRTFRNLAAKPGTGRAEAFRQSMLSLIAEGRPPSYWAPFVVVGEGGRPVH
ncbi:MULTISPECIES: CHAT domain-containing tetratricopeptide repeat protein [Rhodomicrobium]|uniref:CHAT domain-containing protein n=1 Tax=Rhodomicrobium TaxID=1068 RepID=UPI000B4B0C4B|nr:MULTISPECIES: CHAT domain-containing tetratricopeptide repeat protein [Rhodomicrobium]